MGCSVHGFVFVMGSCQLQVKGCAFSTCQLFRLSLSRKCVVMINDSPDMTSAVLFRKN